VLAGIDHVAEVDGHRQLSGVPGVDGGVEPGQGVAAVAAADGLARIVGVGKEAEPDCDRTS
jgi:hypothetical protein